MILYLDTSALVKLYADEVGSKIVRRAVADANLIATSLLSYTETRSALSRRHRAREMGAPDLERCKQEFERDWERFHRLPIDEAVVRKAGDLCEEYALRAFDAVHLAAADSIQAALRAAVTFACFDGALNGAAAACGLRPLSQAQS